MLKLQSAMEYLMTYGWALLIIAVVLIVLYQLGVFSGILGARAQPGSCFVERPNGPYSIQQLATGGSCGTTLPEYVPSFGSSSASQVYSNSISDAAICPNTITAWAEVTSFSGVAGYNDLIVAGTYTQNACDTSFGIYINKKGDHEADFVVSPTNIDGETPCTATSPSGSIMENKWYFLTGTSNGIGCSIYINSTLKNYAVASGPLSGLPGLSPNQVGIGGDLIMDSKDWLPSYISNVQFYNSTLSQSDISALYQEGIGGAPINLVNLAGWWPLNGNEKDYSGDNLNLQATGISYVNSWTSGYTPP